MGDVVECNFKKYITEQTKRGLRNLSLQRCLLPSPVNPEPTWWEVGTDSGKLTSDPYMHLSGLSHTK